MTDEAIDTKNLDGEGKPDDAPVPNLLTDEADDAGKPGDSGSPADEAGENAEKNKGNVVPEAYAEFTLPEGTKIDEKSLAKMTESFKGAGLSQEQAQAVIAAQAEMIKASEESSVSEFNQLMQDWVNTAKADKEIGGEQFDVNVQSARSALKKFGTPELEQALVSSGMTNHPEVIRVFARIGKLLKEDQPGNAGAPQQQQKDRAEILYGTN